MHVCYSVIFEHLCLFLCGTVFTLVSMLLCVAACILVCVCVCVPMCASERVRAIVCYSVHARLIAIATMPQTGTISDMTCSDEGSGR